MGGMKDAAKATTISPLLQKIHGNDARQGSLLSQPFVGKLMTFHKGSTSFLTNKISDSSSTHVFACLSPLANNTRLIDRAENDRFLPNSNASSKSKVDEKMKKKAMNSPSSMESSITFDKYEYLSKYLTTAEYFNFPPVIRPDTPQANTDLSLQFCINNSSNKDKGEASSSKTHPNSLHIEEVPLSEVLEDRKQNKSLNAMKTELRRKSEFNIETQKKVETMLTHRDVADCSAIESLSSNDVARNIGNTRFRVVRLHIINQQRILSYQVFELHRLIKVQKMVAKSPDLVFKSKLSTLRSSHQLEMAASLVKKRNTEIQRPVTGKYTERVKPKLHLPILRKDFVTPAWSLPPSPPGNQWLIPVLSPSEGLVYKPYTGPPPPPSAFMVPNHSHGSPNTPFQFPVSPQNNLNYFPPLDMTSRSGRIQRRSSTSSHVTQAIPIPRKKSQETNNSDIRESIGSSLSEKYKVNMLNLFPTEPEHKQKQEPLFHAIKAIPHDSTSASDSISRFSDPYRKTKEGLKII